MYHRQIRGEHDRVAGQALGRATVNGPVPDRGDAPARLFQSRHGAPVHDLRTGVGRCAGERPADLAHPARGKNTPAIVSM